MSYEKRWRACSRCVTVFRSQLTGTEHRSLILPDVLGPKHVRRTTEVPSEVLDRTNAALEQAACHHTETPVSMNLTGRLIQTGNVGGGAQVLIAVQSDSLAFTSLTDVPRHRAVRLRNLPAFQHSQGYRLH